MVRVFSEFLNKSISLLQCSMMGETQLHTSHSALVKFVRAMAKTKLPHSNTIYPQKHTRTREMHERMNPRGAILDITLHARQQRLPVHSQQHTTCCAQHETIMGRKTTCSTKEKCPERSVDTKETNKNVSFKGRVRILKIPGRSSFTKEEKESMWYTKDEMVELVEKRCDAVAMMIREDDGTHPTTKRGQDEYKVAVMPKRKGRTKASQGKEGTSNNECIDGLRSRHEYKICKVVVQEALNEVLLEQEIQWKEDVSDPEHLADVYFEYTRHNQRQAVERGRRLAMEVERDNYDGSDAKENGVCFNLGKTKPGFPDRRSLQMFLASMDGALMEKYCLTKSRRKGMKGAERRRMILDEAMETVSSTVPDDGTYTVTSSSCPCSQESRASSSTASSSSTPSQSNTSRSSNSKWNDYASGDHTPHPPPRRK